MQGLWGSSSTESGQRSATIPLLVGEAGHVKTVSELDISA